MDKQMLNAGCHEPEGDPERRDEWAKLPPDLAAEIAGRLLGIDLAEYIRFRAVCKPWRQSTEDPHALHSRFLPRNWVVLVNYLDQFRLNHGDERLSPKENYGDETTSRKKFRLLNVATGASLTGVELPGELSGHHAIGYVEGLLVLWNDVTSGIRLLNPLTHAVTDLPGFASIFADASSTAVLENTYQFRGFGFVDGAAASSPPAMVVLLGEVFQMIACIRLGDEPRWALVDTSSLSLDGGGTAKVSFRTTLSLRGRFYMSTSTGDVVTVELDPEPRLVYVIKQATRAAARPTTTPFMGSLDEFYLAPSGGNGDSARTMLMVRRGREKVEVFEVDVDGGKLVPTSTVGTDRAVFIGSARALSVSTRLFPSAATNAVYFCVGLRPVELLFLVVRLDDGCGGDELARIPYNDQVAGPFIGPCNLDVYLAWCVDYVHM
ncbi:hypothetical protein HU200_039311 [Digitaria exilis]|uniref:KIB1-4 beta-propeller domain-containing protein n=1 Tax=Digitaria exilis TaxID=1010633 RepID=A0A835BAS7_9POAL|nr:hypothetical protein HU200_039311 [Digitaria exilis]CAB3447338.1 unnamed protein product [Digitaria exilis]